MEWFSKKTSIAGVEIPNWGSLSLPSSSSYFSTRTCAERGDLLVHALSG